MSLLPNASYAGTTENFWMPATGTINITGGLNVSGLIQSGSTNVAGLANVGALTTAGAVTAGSASVSGTASVTGAVTAGSLLSAGGYNSVALAPAPLGGSYASFGPVFTRPCIVAVNVSNVTTPAAPAGNIAQNRFFLVRLSFTDTGANKLTDIILIDSNVGGAGSNINIQWDSASGTFQFYSNAVPAEATAITFAIMCQA